MEGRAGDHPKRDGCKHADTLKARNHWKGNRVGAGQDLTVLNRFSQKVFYVCSFFFSLLPSSSPSSPSSPSSSPSSSSSSSSFRSRWTVVFRNAAGVSHTSCAFPLGPPSGKGKGRQEAPCKHLDSGWVVRAGVGQSQGSGLEKWVPLQTQALETLHVPPTPRTRQQSENQNRCSGRGTMAIPSTSDKGGLPTERPVATPPPSLELREGAGKAENREGKEGRSGWGSRQGVWSSCPYLPQG